jgi:hypothetical protein
MTKRQFNNFTRLALPLCVALACCGGRASVQQAGAQNSNAKGAAVEENCAKWPEVINATYMQVIEHPIPADKMEATTAKLASGELSMKELVKSLVLSDEYKERFVTPQRADSAVRLLYRHVLARVPTQEEVKSASSQLATKDGFAALAGSLLDSKEYAMRVGASSAPGLQLRPCRFPLKLRQEDSFDGGRMMTTEATIEVDGQIHTATVVKIPSPDKPFCGKVGLWLFDEAGRVLAVIGPPREQLWCVEGKSKSKGEQQRTEEWRGSIPAELAEHAVAVALLQRPANNDPQAMTRENSERAQQIKRLVR